MSNINEIIAKRYQSTGASISQLASLYGRHRDTIYKWLKPFESEIGTINESRIYTPRQIEIIFNKIGLPY